MYVESCTILVVVNHLSRPVVVLDGLPGLYRFKYDSATACELPLYLYSYKLVGSVTPVASVVAPSIVAELSTVDANCSSPPSPLAAIVDSSIGYRALGDSRMGSTDISSASGPAFDCSSVWMGRAGSSIRLTLH